MHICAYARIEDYEWDPVKARADFTKHKIHLADAVGALEDESALTIRDPYDEEERWITLGIDSIGKLLVVVYTWRGQTIRVISARGAAPGERRQYEEAHEG